MKITDTINQQYAKFISQVKPHLENLEQSTIAGLEEIVIESYQFTVRNLQFLLDSANMTASLEDKNIEREFRHNLEEEQSHPELYKQALAQIGTHVETRKNFPPTTILFDTLDSIIKTSSSSALGAMYAMEGSAIFASEVCYKLCEEIATRRGIDWNTTALSQFHSAHLNEIEQSHRDDLGVFIDKAESSSSNHELNLQEILSSAIQAVEAISTWGKELLTKITGKDQPNPIACCIASFYAKPDYQHDLMQSLFNVIKIGRLDEACLQYELLLNKENPHFLTLIVKFKNQEALDQHEQHPQIKHFIDTEIKKYCEKIFWNDAVLIERSRELD